MPTTELLISGQAQIVAPTLEDGDVIPLPITADGRLKVSSKLVSMIQSLVL